MHNLMYQRLTEIMNIWNSYIWTAEWRNKCKEDPRSYYRNLCSCEKQAWKNQACRDSNPDLCDTGAALSLKLIFGESKFLKWQTKFSRPSCFWFATKKRKTISNNTSPLWTRNTFPWQKFVSHAIQTFFARFSVEIWSNSTLPRLV